MDISSTGPDSSEALNLAEVLQDCASCAILALDRDLRVCAASPELERLTGVNPATLHGVQPTALPEGFAELARETLQRRAPVGERQIQLNPASGNSFSVRARGIPCFNAGGEAKAVILVVQGVAVEKLGLSIQRLDRLASVGTLSASMAHEIKNALVAVDTFVQDLIERNRDSELADLVRREFRRVDSIVSQMLKLAGPARPNLSELSLHRIVDQSLRLIHPQLEARQIQLHRALQAERDAIQGDEYQLEQALLNLLLNAIAAMETGGHLTVSTQLAKAPGTPPALQLSIIDSGSGIAPENMNRLFEPFFSTKPHGTGLGLAITRRIVLEHRGQITVESQPGRGTTFRILLPLSDPRG